MILYLAGDGSETILDDLEAAAIEYTRRQPPAGVIMNSGEAVEIAKMVAGASPWGAFAWVLVAWIRARASRKVIITQNDNTIFHAEGMTVDEIAKLLPLTKSVMAADTKKPEKRK